MKEAAPAGAEGGNERDTYFKDAGKFIIEKDKASIGMLQRVFKIGFNRQPESWISYVRQEL